MLSRTRAVFIFPAHFMLAASINPCPYKSTSGMHINSREKLKE
ncbi:hypothetical protein [Paenibacillus gallinarum]